MMNLEGSKQQTIKRNWTIPEIIITYWSRILNKMAEDKNDMENISEDIKIDKLKERPKKNKKSPEETIQKNNGKGKVQKSAGNRKSVPNRGKRIDNSADTGNEENNEGTGSEEYASKGTEEADKEKKEHTGFKLFVIIGIVMAVLLIAFVLVVANLDLSAPETDQKCPGEDCLNDTVDEPDPAPDGPDFTRPPIVVRTPTPAETCERRVNDSWCLGYFENEYGKCLEYPTAKAKRCIDEYYLIRAIRDDDRTLCQYIEDDKKSAICLIYLLKDSSKCELHEEMNDYCKAVVENNVNLCQVVEDDPDQEECIVLAAKLKAMETGDEEECIVLNDELERLRCEALALDSEENCETEKDFEC